MLLKQQLIRKLVGITSAEDFWSHHSKEGLERLFAVSLLFLPQHIEKDGRLSSKDIF